MFLVVYQLSQPTTTPLGSQDCPGPIVKASKFTSNYPDEIFFALESALNGSKPSNENLGLVEVAQSCGTHRY